MKFKLGDVVTTRGCFNAQNIFGSVMFTGNIVEIHLAETPWETISVKWHDGKRIRYNKKELVSLQKRGHPITELFK